MLTVIVILLVLSVLLNLAIGILIVVAFGDLDAAKKYRFEFEPAESPNDRKHGDDAIQDAAQKQFH
jgi:hypothetical protein